MTSGRRNTKSGPVSISAPGAVQLSSQALISTSPADACQSVRDPAEPEASVLNCKAQAEGAFLNRRSFMTAMLSLPLAAAPTSVQMMQEPTGPHPDAKIFDLVEEYVAAEQRCSDAILAADRLDQPKGPPPEVLRIQQRDLQLGRKPTFAPDEYWQRPCDMGQWRSLDHWEYDKTETDDCMTVVSRQIPASAELVARGAEIVAAFNAWSGKPQRGYVKAMREMKRTQRNCSQVRNKLCETQATTLEGLRAKLRCLEIDGSFDDIGRSYAEPVIGSLLEDLRRMSDGASA
jgi:hypothetical protein